MADNPVLYLKSIVAVAASGGMDLLKSHVIAAPLSKALLIKHFGDNADEADAKLESLGVVNGLDGMEFGMSTMFTTDHPEEIHLVVYYKLKVIQLFQWADFEANICKESRARAWLGGDNVTKTAVAEASPAAGGETPEEETPAEETPEEETPEEETPDAEALKAQMVEKYGQTAVDAVSDGVDTSAWTEDDWEYQIWLFQNDDPAEEPTDADVLKAQMIVDFGQEAIDAISDGVDTSAWTEDDWYYQIYMYLYADGEAVKATVVEKYGQDVIDAVGDGVDTSEWTRDDWEYYISLYLNTVADENTGLTQYQIDQIVNADKGSRPDPTEYLSDEYISEHLTNFSSGAAYIMSESTYNTYYAGQDKIARSDGSLFVLPLDYMNQVIEESNGDLSYIEEKLGYEPGSLSAGNYVVVKIENPEDYGITMPSGNEEGANDYWVPGGYTSGGLPEAVVYNVPNDDATVGDGMVYFERK